MLKILHTSDWHLGRKIYSRSFESEQQQFLDWLVEYIENNQIDLFMLAGDIFDIPHPPNSSIRIFNEFLIRLNKIKTLQSFIISGNHDSSNFFNAISPLFRNTNVHLIAKLEDFEKIHVLEKNDQKVKIQSLPYFKWSDLINLKNKIDIKDENDELTLLKKVFKTFGPIQEENCIRVFMGHHLFGNYEAAGSEQGLHLSGINSIPTHLFKNIYDLMILGHIHNSQLVSKSSPQASYAGSPIAFRFGEQNQKSVMLYNIHENKIESEKVMLPNFIKLIQVKCDEENWKSQIGQSKLKNENENTFYEIILNFKEPNNLLSEEIRLFCNNLGLRVLNYKINLGAYDIINYENKNQIEELDTEKLFKIYYERMNNQVIPETIFNEFHQLLQECREMINIDEKSKEAH